MSGSDIPLNYIRRNRNNKAAGYTSLATESPGLTPDEPRPNKRMPAATRAAAASSRLFGGHGQGRRRERYTDDPEEETGLLGAASSYAEEDELLDEERERAEQTQRPQSPRSVSLVLISHSVSTDQAPTQRLPPILRSRRSAPKDRSRTIPFRPPDKLISKYPPNIVKNQKYNAFTFLPIVFYEQFKFFFNLYFLLVALSQFVPALKIGESCGCFKLVVDEC